MRLFIAVKIPERSKRLLEDKFNTIIDEVEENIKWVTPDKWHLTLKFLGEVERQKIELLKKIMTEVTSSYYKFPLLFKNIGAFPHLNYPKVVFIDIKKGKKYLQQINNDLEKILVQKGFKADNKEYTPHLTIARSRNNTDCKQLAGNLKKFQKPFFVNVHMKTESISLFKSELFPEGPVYEELYNVSLKSNRE